MSDSAQTETLPSIEHAVDTILNSIEREREREIISRRFGLYDRKETLEQIGELLGIERREIPPMPEHLASLLEEEKAKA